jgi:methylglyoxal synthase
MRRHPAGSLLITLGVVASDTKKDELQLFARAHRRTLEALKVLAPEDTANALAEMGVGAQGLAPDALGGDIQLAAAVLDGDVHAVILLRDPVLPLAGDPDTLMMLKVCDLERVPIATNIATAEVLIGHLAEVHGALSLPQNEPHPDAGPGRVIKFVER